MIADTENEAANYARALANSPGAVVERALEQQAREVDARYNALTQRRDELKAVLESRRLSDEAVDAALDFRERIVAGLEEATFEDKREVLDRLGVEVTIKGGQAQISCRIPTQPSQQLSIKPFVV